VEYKPWTNTPLTIRSGSKRLSIFNSRILGVTTALGTVQ
jgi:hypothetical protein